VLVFGFYIEKDKGKNQNQFCKMRFDKRLKNISIGPV